MSGAQPTQNTTFLFSGNPTFLFGTYNEKVDNFNYIKLTTWSWRPLRRYSLVPEAVTGVGSVTAQSSIRQDECAQRTGST
jgi:hypothetical protein